MLLVFHAYSVPGLISVSVFYLVSLSFHVNSSVDEFLCQVHVSQSRSQFVLFPVLF